MDNVDLVMESLFDICKIEKVMLVYGEDSIVNIELYFFWCELIFVWFVIW